MVQRSEARVCIIYPADPLGVIPGGIDSFIRGVLRWAPDDIQFSVIGVTTDAGNRPVGKWTTCDLGGRRFQFLPVVRFDNSERQAKMPLTVRFVAGLIGSRREIKGDVLEFHRIEPCFLFLRDDRPKTLVMHQNMSVIRSRGSDIRWKYFPWLYFAVEKVILERVQSVFCVREDAVRDYQQKFPDRAARFHFTPTWFDTEVFSAPSPSDRDSSKQLLSAEFGFPFRGLVFVWVGRMDKQKNPLLMIDAFARVHGQNPDARLLLVGDGVLRDPVERRIKSLGLLEKVVLCGIRQAPEIARYLHGADAFLLTSAYEGMPICVLEALGSGLPVVSTDVGEVSRVVTSGVNGELIAVHDSEHVAAAMLKCLDNLERYRGKPSVSAAAVYTPEKVLAPIYENYRKLTVSQV